MISSHLWQRLTPQQQQWLQAAADDSAKYQRTLWAKAEQDALDAVKKAGVTIISPYKRPFADAIKDMFNDYQSDKTAYQYIQRIQATNIEKQGEQQDEQL